ncbi:MAG: alkaline phosphatase family protein [Chitinophagales bacterium]|nr:alkaline phosphatase family protein [Chitinophagales bacterium]
MKKLLIILSVAMLWSCSKDKSYEEPYEEQVSKIAFGSCSNQIGDKGIFNTIVDKNPDLYISMGDAVYADNPLNADYGEWFDLQYNLLAADAAFKNLRRNVPMIATWDDHDYGTNNAGREFPYKYVAKNKFVQFWQVPSSQDIYGHNGVFSTYNYGDEAHRVQVILLDTRWFKDFIGGEPIQPTLDSAKGLLGEEQWTWLENELKKPAKIRIIGSSTQLCIEANGWESWANYPIELDRFFSLIRKTQANGVFVISGDVHYAELSMRQPTGNYPIYDLTSSGLTHTENSLATNSYRIGDGFNDLNFGMININWNASPIEISLEIYDKAGTQQIQKTINLNEISF